ncbi:MAG: hypothetical protein K2N23_08455 [Clostridia bacterium]|nr:hypothetical protein [Clostridia bacterium]
MNEQLDYAEMLEIPVNTVNVTKKRSIFKRKQKAQPQDDIKDLVVESVNERMGAYVISEDVSDPPKPEKIKTVNAGKRDKKTVILWTEAALVGILAIGIFITNLLMPSTVINTFLSSFSKPSEEEPVYSQLTLSPIVGDFSDAEVSLNDGVLCFTAEGSVYPVCGGTVAAVQEANGTYTMEIAHTSTFKSVITGLNSAYSAVGTKVAQNIPVGYSDGKGEVRVTLYDNGVALNCFTLNGETPVWTVQ